MGCLIHRSENHIDPQDLNEGHPSH